MEQTGSKLEKEYVKAVYCHSAYLYCMQSVSWEMLVVESQAEIKIARRNINNLIYGRKQRTKEPLDESERGEWKSWLKTQHSEN